MKVHAAIVVMALEFSLLTAPISLCAAQNPLAALENAAKEKAAEEALTKVLNDNLPLTLNAKDVYPTATTLPGGPFNAKPLQLTADQLDQPLPPGDYTINTLAFCSEYSVHQPGAGTAYVLGPYEGKAAGAVGALIWRGTVQYHINSNSLQAVSWAIQSGLTYEQMPKTYQAIVDQVIPDLKGQITGDFVANLESTYNSLAKAASLPPLDTILSKLGDPGKLALDAERQRAILTAQSTNDQLKEQTLFQGQESGIYTPVSAENGPWTERVPRQVYMKLQIVGGNMNSNNVMQIRVMPPPATTARNRGNDPRPVKARLVRASYGPGRTESTGSSTQPTITSILEGVIGYSVGRGAQALGQVAAALSNVHLVTPAEAAETSPQPDQCPVLPTPAASAVCPAAVPTPASKPTSPPSSPSEACAISTCTPGAGDTAPNVTFASCSSAITSLQLYNAYKSLYQGSPTFQCLMNQIRNKVEVLVVDGTNYMGQYFQCQANAGYKKTNTNNPSLSSPAPGDYAFTLPPQVNGKYQKDGVIDVVISAQNLLSHVYTTGFNNVPAGAQCGTSVNPITTPESLQQLMAYELGENANCLSNVPGFTEQVDEERTNRIMQELAAAQHPALCFQPDIDADQYDNCKIQSGAAEPSSCRAAKPNNGKDNGVLDFTNPQLIAGSTEDPKSADVYNGAGSTAGTRGCTFKNPPKPCSAAPATSAPAPR